MKPPEGNPNSDPVPLTGPRMMISTQLKVGNSSLSAWVPTADPELSRIWRNSTYAVSPIRYNPDVVRGAGALIQQAVGTVSMPFEILGMPTGISLTVLREKIVVGPVIPSRADSADILSTEPLGKCPLFNCLAHANDNIGD